MPDIKHFRTQIDDVDKQLLVLLNRRLELAQEIGKIKNREGLPIYAPEREEQLLRSLIARSEGPLSERALRAIYREIMSAALALEKNIIIACYGETGNPSHQAAIQKFGSSVTYTFFHEMEAAFTSVESDEAECVVVPIEYHDSGAVNVTLDALATTSLSICAEIYLPLSISKDSANDRFLVLGRKANPPSGEDLSILLLRIEDKPGSLVSALEPFKDHEVNLSHFASRPAAKGSEDVFIFIEAGGHIEDTATKELFRELSKRCRAVKALGSYPKLRTGEHR
ncbi:MAG: chorismate mutase [Chthoniobacterales bacterium]